ncbi:hypothetical protein BDV19DRAFT_362601 [Aspergillus venezuelensis]
MWNHTSLTSSSPPLMQLFYPLPCRQSVLTTCFTLTIVKASSPSQKDHGGLGRRRNQDGTRSTEWDIGDLAR